MMDETSEMQPFMNDRDNHMNNGGARRRGIGNNSMTIENQLPIEETYFVSATSFNPPPPPEDDDKKDHGRSFFNRFLGNVSSFVSSLSLRRNSYKGEYTPSATGDTTLRSQSGSLASTLVEYYKDDFNDESWSCTFGTSENDGIWMNREDPPGTILSVTVMILIVYSSLTVILLAQTDHLAPELVMVYFTISMMSLSCHMKTSFTDPGTIPESAVPVESMNNDQMCHPMCSQCQTFKPPFSHHCRVCNRCVSRMDHHCPWMNNCIGAGNMKHFILFLFYTWLGSALALLIFGWNYFLCSDESCQFSNVLIQLVRVMTFICIATLLFTSSMIMNVTYGIISGIGTIDRLKKKANNTMGLADEKPLLLKDIFGVAGYHTWPFPIDPVFEDFDRVMGYSTPQRLLREQTKDNVRVPMSIPSKHDRDYAHA